MPLRNVTHPHVSPNSYFLFLSYCTKSEVKELNVFIATFVRRLGLNVSRYSPKIDSLTSSVHNRTCKVGFF